MKRSRSPLCPAVDAVVTTMLEAKYRRQTRASFWGEETDHIYRTQILVAAPERD